MNSFIKRSITGLISGLIFFGTYHLSLTLFLGLMTIVFLYILIIECPPLMGGVKSLKFWLITPLYPIIPMLCLLSYIYVMFKHSFWLPLYPFQIAWGCDTASYITGSLIGRHKIVPTISPGKTWQGLMGGFIAVFLINFLAMPHMDGIFPHTWPWLMQYSIIGTLLAFFGDIFVSYLKRKVRIKDTGALLPGHGGLLDRFDSLMFISVWLWLTVWLYY